MNAWWLLRSTLYCSSLPTSPCCSGQPTDSQDILLCAAPVTGLLLVRFPSTIRVLRQKHLMLCLHRHLSNNMDVGVQTGMKGMSHAVDKGLAVVMVEQNRDRRLAVSDGGYRPWKS